MAVRNVRLPYEHSGASKWRIIGVVWSPGEQPKTETLPDDGRVALLVGGSTFVRAAGRCGPACIRGRLLRGGLLQRAGTSSPQAAASSVRRFSAHGLRARLERDDTLFDVLLQRRGASGADTGRVRAASIQFCSGCG